MVPTEFMETAVAVLANALPQLFYLGNKIFARHLVKVGVQIILLTESDDSRSHVCRC
jgi:hypothetical protein